MPDDRHQNDRAKGLRQLPDGGYILAGVGGGGGTGMMVRTDSTGGMIWTSYLPEEEGLRNIDACELAENDHFVVVSGSMAAEVDGDGEVVWFQDYDGVARINRVIRSNEGCFLLVGSGNRDMKTIKIDSEGEIVWRRTYATENSDYGIGGIRTSDGGYCLVGTSHFGLGHSLHSIIVRTDPEGEVIWQRVYDEFQQGDFLEDVVETADGGFAVAGCGQDDSNGSRDYYLLRVDSEGEPLWRVYYGEIGTEECYSLILMEDGGYLLGGFATGDGAWLVRTEPDPLYEGAVTLIDPAFPSFYSFEPPYPNPFNSSCCFVYQVPEPEHVNVSVFDLTGRLVETLVDDPVKPGSYKLVWSARHRPSGVYFCRLKAGGYTGAIKLNLVR